MASISYDMAAYLGITIRSLNRTLKKLKEE
jgi:hypothetical protein